MWRQLILSCISVAPDSRDTLLADFRRELCETERALAVLKKKVGNLLNNSCVLSIDLANVGDAFQRLLEQENRAQHLTVVRCMEVTTLCPCSCFVENFAQTWLKQEMLKMKERIRAIHI